MQHEPPPDDPKLILEQLRILAVTTTERARRRPNRRNVSEAERAVRAYREAVDMVERHLSRGEG